MKLGKRRIAFDDQAPALYSKVLGPTWNLARNARHHAFFGELGEFVKKFREQAWPFTMDSDKKSVVDQLESIYSQAIDLNGNVPTYHYELGKVYLDKRPAEVSKAQAAAEILKRLNADGYLVHSLLGRVFFTKSRQQKTVAEKLSDIERRDQRVSRFRVQNLARGVEPRPTGSTSRPVLVVQHGAPRAGELFRSHGGSKQAFTDAVKYGDQARQAAERIADESEQRELKERAFQALGNAYEDLAWLARDKIEDNYKMANVSFKAASSQRESGTSLMHWARCYYKIIAESDTFNEDGKRVPRNVQFIDNMSRQKMHTLAPQQPRGRIQVNDPVE